jgi:bifunctional oligoribonuclease and PAP phosphatase NrnA
MKSHPKIIDRILETIAQSQTICVAGHVRPDGDCIGSQLGLTLALRKQGKEVTCWNEDPCRKNTPFWTRTICCKNPAAGAGIRPGHRTDCASFERLGNVGPAVGKRKCLINIDHHQSNTRYGDVNWISAREASTGELIFRCCRRPLAHHPGHCRLPFHRRLDRHRAPSNIPPPSR